MFLIVLFTFWPLATVLVTGKKNAEGNYCESLVIQWIGSTQELKPLRRRPEETPTVFGSEGERVE